MAQPYKNWTKEQAPYRREAQRRELMSDPELRALLEREMGGQ